MLGEIAASSEHPDVDAAVIHYRQALALAEQLKMRPLSAYCQLGLGKLYRRAGMLEDARRLEEVLLAKQIPAWIDRWGYDVNHDWPWWRKMLPHFLSALNLPAPDGAAGTAAS